MNGLVYRKYEYCNDKVSIIYFRYKITNGFLLDCLLNLVRNPNSDMFR